MFAEKYKSVIDEYENFWERKNKKRCILNLSHYVAGTNYYRAPESLEEKWLDVDYIYTAYKHNLSTSGYLAEGIPMIFTNYGPGCLAACIGGTYELAPNTVWFDRKQFVEDFENPPAIEFDEQSDMWKNILRFENKMMSDPDIHFSLPDLGGIIDIVASLRNTEPLLYDLYDYPEEVKAFSKRVTEIWLEVFNSQIELIRKTGQPFNSWMNIPSKKPWYPLQADFAYMISPAQFEEFVLPDLVTQTENMPRSIYHLDGVGQIAHIDMLLDIPGLSGIQWTPGDGNDPLWDKKWFTLYKKIQDKNKNLVLLGGINEWNLDRTEAMIKTLDPTGLFISVHCSSKEKAEDILEKVTRWSE